MLVLNLLNTLIRFLQARLHLDSLNTTATLRKLKEALKTLPEGLNQTYDETFRRINAQHPDQASLATRALYWVFHASKPLSILQLQHALAVEIGDQTLDEDNIPDDEMLLSWCYGLLINQKKSGLLSLVHYTLQEYLELKARDQFPQAQVEMARTCLTYLSFDEFKTGPCHGDHNFEARLRQWPLLRYAASKWGHHASGSAEEKLKTPILEFLSHSTAVSASVQVLCVRKSKGLDYSSRFPENVPALWLASFWGLEATLLHLLATQGDSVHARTSWGDTALHRAVGCGHERVVQLLLEHGAEASAKDRAGNSPLHLATLSFLDDVLAHDIRTSTRLEIRGRKPHQVRTLNYSLAVKHLLLSHGADVNAVNRRGESPLLLAVCDGHSSLAKMLLEHGADVTLNDRSNPLVGSTFLSLSPTIRPYVLPLYQRMGHWMAPLSAATECGQQEIMKVLLEYDLVKQIKLGVLDDALQRAVNKDHLPSLKILLSKSPKLSRNKEGRTLIHSASFSGSLKCLRYLAELGIDLEILDEQKRTCLHYAAAGSGEATKFLLDRGLEARQRDMDGWTPLTWAARGGRDDSTRMLLDAGTPLEYAEQWLPFAVANQIHRPYSELAELLKPSGQDMPMILENLIPMTFPRHKNVVCDGCDLVNSVSIP